jgi:outer membrane protein
MYKLLLGSLLASMAFAAPSQTAPTEADCQQASDNCAAIGRWNFSVALGAGVRTNPVIHSQDIPLVVIPQVSYYGKRVFLNNLDLGFTLAEGNSSSISLIASPGYDRVFFYRSDLQNIFVSGFSGSGYNATVVRSDAQGAVAFPPKSRRITYLAGPEWTFKFEGVTGQVDLLHEITAQDHGNEIRAALGIPLIERGRIGSLGVNVGITWKSAAIVNYYYGSPNLYEAGSALNPFIKFKFSRPLSGKWRLDALVQYERLGRAIANSPIVTEDQVVTAFIGATYPF